AVFPDSLTPRGEAEICTQKLAERRIDQAERRADTLAALAWVAAQPWVSPTRIALLGWSHGGSAVLSATDANRSDVMAAPARPAVAIAFYPGCADALKKGYRPAAPLVMMLGELDDWTPPGPCIALGKNTAAEVNVFPGSYHDFDNPLGTVKVRRDVPNGVNAGRGVHAGPNPAAREQAYARLRDVLAGAFKQEARP
ncbi:MAG: dienelactone hydrolase family protein, partial [Ramlibacter sp.]